MRLLARESIITEKTLVAYFSASGVTEQLVKRLAKATGTFPARAHFLNPLRIGGFSLFGRKNLKCPAGKWKWLYNEKTI